MTQTEMRKMAKWFAEKYNTGRITVVKRHKPLARAPLPAPYWYSEGGKLFAWGCPVVGYVVFARGRHPHRIWIRAGGSEERSEADIIYHELGHISMKYAGLAIPGRWLWPGEEAAADSRGAQIRREYEAYCNAQ